MEAVRIEIVFGARRFAAEVFRLNSSLLFWVFQIEWPGDSR
jgi:hypothetical protein